MECIEFIEKTRGNIWNVKNVNIKRNTEISSLAK